LGLSGNRQNTVLTLFRCYPAIEKGIIRGQNRSPVEIKRKMNRV